MRSEAVHLIASDPPFNKRSSELRGGHLRFQEDDSGLLHIRRSKTDREAEGAVL